MTDSAFHQFKTLCEKKELAAYNVMAAATHALASLNLNDPDAARRILERAVFAYREADQAITEFHRKQTSKKENQSHGNSTASAA